MFFSGEKQRGGGMEREILAARGGRLGLGEGAALKGRRGGRRGGGGGAVKPCACPPYEEDDKEGWRWTGLWAQREGKREMGCSLKRKEFSPFESA